MTTCENCDRTKKQHFKGGFCHRESHFGEHYLEDKFILKRKRTSDSRRTVKGMREENKTSKFKEIADWLQNEAEERMKQAMSREEMARAMRAATPQELRAAKMTAEKMSGKKLNGVSATVEAAQKSAGIDERIAAKLDAEARKLSAWADYLLTQV
jgi:hypothetical protein